MRAYLDGILPSFGGVKHGSANSAAQALGLPELVRSTTLVPPALGVDANRSGTAIDFRARIALGSFNPRGSAAALGVAELPFYADGLENGFHRTRVLAEAFDVATEILRSSAAEAELDRASILLACSEQVHRAGGKVLRGSLGDALDAANDGLEFALQIGEPSLADVRALMQANAGQLDQWRVRVGNGERFEPNPVFDGSRLVGGADGDWLLGDTLIESKAYAELTVPVLRGFIRQLLGYVMLDLEDALHIRSIGLWLPRQGVTKVWPLEQVLGRSAEDVLVKLREGFRTAANGKGVALRIPVTQRRKDQVLADNRYTPPQCSPTSPGASTRTSACEWDATLRLPSRRCARLRATGMPSPARVSQATRTLRWTFSRCSPATVASACRGRQPRIVGLRENLRRH